MASCSHAVGQPPATSSASARRRCRGAVSPASAPVVRRKRRPRRARRAARSPRRPSSRPRRPTRTGAFDGALGELGQPTRLHPQVAGAALARLERDHRRGPGALQLATSGARSSASPPYPGTTQHRPRPGLVDGPLAAGCGPAAPRRRQDHDARSTSSRTRRPRRVAGRARVAGGRLSEPDGVSSSSISSGSSGTTIGRDPRPGDEEDRGQDHHDPAHEVDVEPVGLRS